MEFKDQLQKYAEILVRHGLNVQPGQLVNISSEPYHREFSLIVAEEAYKAGAKFVNIDLTDPKALRLRIKHSSEDDLKYVPAFVTPKYNELVDGVGANLKILGPEEPDIMSDLDPKKVNVNRLYQRLALQRFYDDGIGKSQVHWTVAAAATPKWAQKIFPNLGPIEAESRLWECIFSICRIDRPDPLTEWKRHNEVLRGRASKLSSLGIKSLHFTGPETDLTVGLSERALWKGGTDKSPRGVEYEPNIPTEECFTTPDYRLTSGRVRATRPFLINGVLIQNLEMEFVNGEISKFKASSGEETFREYINSDSGAKRLGEVALVGIDSPIFRTGLVFQEILFDENAACHIAVGSAYKFCIRDGASLDSKSAAAIGCNESSVHTDMMISSEHVDVTATLNNGSTVMLISKGAWCDF